MAAVAASGSILKLPIVQITEIEGDLKYTGRQLPAARHPPVHACSYEQNLLVTTYQLNCKQCDPQCIAVDFMHNKWQMLPSFFQTMSCTSRQRHALRWIYKPTIRVRISLDSLYADGRLTRMDDRVAILIYLFS